MATPSKALLSELLENIIWGKIHTPTISHRFLSLYGNRAGRNSDRTTFYVKRPDWYVDPTTTESFLYYGT